LFEFSRRTTPMLVLSRKPGEKIHVGSTITITVVHVRGNQVRLGIDAPDQVRILRAELVGWQEGPAGGEGSAELVPVGGGRSARQPP
jgi:carbon storage regulator CsrA